jgi:hypothetical protein
MLQPLLRGLDRVVIVSFAEVYFAQYPISEDGIGQRSGCILCTIVSTQKREKTCGIYQDNVHGILIIRSIKIIIRIFLF